MNVRDVVSTVSPYRPASASGCLKIGSLRPTLSGLRTTTTIRRYDQHVVALEIMRSITLQFTSSNNQLLGILTRNLSDGRKSGVAVFGPSGAVGWRIVACTCMMLASHVKGTCCF